VTRERRVLAALVFPTSDRDEGIVDVEELFDPIEIGEINWGTELIGCG